MAWFRTLFNGSGRRLAFGAVAECATGISRDDGHAYSRVAEQTVVTKLLLTRLPANLAVATSLHGLHNLPNTSYLSDLGHLRPNHFHTIALFCSLFCTGALCEVCAF